MRTTIKDIAKLTGVSHTTVSRALNNSPLISDSQKLRILEMAKKMNYSPNMLARGLSGNRSYTIGVILNFFGNPFAQRIMNGVENVAEANGYVMIFGDSRESAKREQKYIQTFLDRGVDGLIIYPVALESSRKNVSLIKSINKPYVMVNHQPHGTRSDLVSCDHYQGGLLAAQHLLELNHRKIAILGGRGLTVQSDVVQGFNDAMLDKGLHFNPEYLTVFDASYLDQKAIAATTVQLMHDNPEITAILAYSDEIIPGIFNGLHQVNKKVPEDISVVGFGNIPEVSASWTNLTTVDYKKEKVGEEAMKLLLHKAESKESQISTIRIPMELIHGDTTRMI